SSQLANGQRRLAQRTTPGAPLAGCLGGGLAAEPRDLCRVAEVAEAVGSLAEQICRINKPCPFGLVFRHNLLKRILGSYNSLRHYILVLLAEGGKRTGLQDIKVSEAGRRVAQCDATLS